MPTAPMFSPLTVSFSTLFFIIAVLVSSVRSVDPLLRLPSAAQHLAQDNDDSHLCPRQPDAEHSGSSSCPIKCFRTDPVCGVDGNTYWCGCADAHCSGTRVAKLGFCEVGNGGSGPLSGQALLLVHIVWLILLGIFVLFGLL